MNELNKKCLVVFLVFGMMMLFVGYHLGNKGESPQWNIRLQSSFATQGALESEESTDAVDTGANQIKAPQRLWAENSPNLMTRMKAPLVSNHNAENKPVSQLLQSNRATKKREILKDPLENNDRLSQSHNLSLQQDVIDRVKTFVFFIGYSRSGSSIISSLMDAHPHMVIAYEYKVISKWNDKLNNKAYLYETLYNKTQKDATTGWRSEQNMAKNYTLHIDTGWQGRYDKYISVIGDKNAENTVGTFLDSKPHFSEVYTQLQETVKVAVKAVFVVRNPYDIISTRVLYRHSDELREMFKTNSPDKDSPKVGARTKPATDFKLYMRKIKESGDEQAYKDAKFRAEDLKELIQRVARYTKAISEMIDLLGSENVWQVHNMDLVNNPKATMMEMCDFFNVCCSDDYIQTCVDSVFKSVSKTRELVHWPQTEKQLVKDKIINTFPFFNRYTYDSD